MKQLLPHTPYKSGFGLLIIITAVAIISALGGGLVYVFNDEVSDFFTKPETQDTQKSDSEPANNPFPTRPPSEPQLPQEKSTLPQDDGAPITAPKVTTAGEWHGTFTVTSPAECVGIVGGWEANISDTNGIVGGNFTTDVGISGRVNGSRDGSTAQWSVGGGGSGVSFRGEIYGNTISGSFTGEECPVGGRTSGNFFGGRIVQ